MKRYLQLIIDMQLMTMQDMEEIREDNIKTQTLAKMYRTLSDMRDELDKLK